MKRYGIVILITGLVGIQFFPTSPNQNKTISQADFSNIFRVPSEIQTLLKTSCYDCHSNNTNYPWYSKIQPGAWFVEKHINEGKEELNFSEFGRYSKRRQKGKLKSIISQIKDTKMPLTSYILMHNDAKFSEKDRKLLEEWFTNLRDNLLKITHETHL